MGMMARHNKKARAAQKAVLAKKPVLREEVQKEVKSTSYLTKTDISTMKVADLREFAKKQGIEDADDISGGELKSLLIEKMGL